MSIELHSASIQNCPVAVAQHLTVKLMVVGVTIPTGRNIFCHFLVCRYDVGFRYATHNVRIHRQMGWEQDEMRHWASNPRASSLCLPCCTAWNLKKKTYSFKLFFYTVINDLLTDMNAKPASNVSSRRPRSRRTPRARTAARGPCPARTAGAATAAATRCAGTPAVRTRPAPRPARASLANCAGGASRWVLASLFTEWKTTTINKNNSGLKSISCVNFFFIVNRMEGVSGRLWCRGNLTLRTLVDGEYLK